MRQVRYAQTIQPSGNATNLFTPVAEKKNLEFRVEVAPECPAYIETDDQRLEQILRNLLGAGQSGSLTWRPRNGLALVKELDGLRAEKERRR
jgi:hypothetical protein